jgi:Tol biopolymer transport system component
MNIRKLNIEDGTSEFFFDGNNRNRSDRELHGSSNGNAFVYNSVSGLSSRVTYINKSTGLKSVMPNMGNASWANWPTVSPNGRYMAYTEGATIIYLYDSNMGVIKPEHLRRLTHPEASYSDLYPDFSPDGQSLVLSPTATRTTKFTL